VNTRKIIETWDAEVEEHLEVVSEVTSRETDSQAFQEFMDVRFAHWDALRREYTKPRWAFLRSNLYCGKPHAFADFFNELSSLKVNESLRLVAAY
jgi:hypothetical protein